MAADEHELVERARRAPRASRDGRPASCARRGRRIARFWPRRCEDPLCRSRSCPATNERIEPAGEPCRVHGAALADRRRSRCRHRARASCSSSSSGSSFKAVPEIEGAHAKHLLQIDAAIAGRVNARERIERTDSELEAARCSPFGSRSILLMRITSAKATCSRASLSVELIAQMPGIDDRHDGVEREAARAASRRG